VSTPEGESFLFGGVLYPLGEQPVAESLLQACDPALAKLIDFLTFEINLKIGLALTSAVARGNPPIAMNIRKVLTVDPFTHAEKAEQLAFPLFAMWLGTTYKLGVLLDRVTFSR